MRPVGAGAQGSAPLVMAGSLWRCREQAEEPVRVAVELGRVILLLLTLWLRLEWLTHRLPPYKLHRVIYTVHWIGIQWRKETISDTMDSEQVT